MTSDVFLSCGSEPGGRCGGPFPSDLFPEDGRVRGARPSDLDAVTAIDALSFSVPWSKISFEPYFLPEACDSFVLVARDEAPGLAGFAVVQCLGRTMELLRLAVHPTFRKRGTGKALMTQMMRRADAAGAEEFLLEVRDGNLPAIRLYEGFGFVPVGRRRGYYSDSGEDAVLMTAYPPYDAGSSRKV